MKTSNHYGSTVPRLTSRFLAWALPNNLVDPVLGDLSEEYNQRLISTNEVAAKHWYVRQAIQSGIGYMFITKRNFIMFIFSLCFFAVMTLYAMYIAAGISPFIDIPSIVILLPTALAFTYGATSLKTVHLAINILLSHDETQSELVYKQSQRVFSILGNSGVMIGAFMTLLGLVTVAQLTDDITVLGPAIAVSLLTIFYGLAIKIVCYIAQHKIQTLSENKRLNDIVN